MVRVNYFFSLHPNVNCSIDKVIRSHPDLLKNQLLPICNGESGDLICIDLTKDRYENVFYWFHEAFEGKELTLIANTVKDFWMKLQIREENLIDEEAMKNIEVKASPKLLEMLRKSGYGPKE